MAEHKKRRKEKVWWRDFKDTEAYIAIQQTARDHGFHLKVVYDDNGIALDVHPMKFVDES